MVVILIRHANDNDVDPIHRNDQELTMEGKKHSIIKGRYLKKRYGNPTKVYCSTMMRAKQTSKYMLRNNEDIDVIYTNSLCRYFSSSEKMDPSLFLTTANEDVPIYESWDEFKDRCKRFYRRMKKLNMFRSDKVYWVITHSLVINQILRRYGKHEDKHIRFLKHYTLR